MLLKSQPETIRICVVVPLELGYFRALIRGIASHQPQSGIWNIAITHFPRVGTATDSAADVVARSLDGAHAVIGSVGSPKMTAILAPFQIPIINVTSRHANSPFPQVTLDNVEAGRLAAMHLIERGYRRLVFTGRKSHYGHQRFQGFAEVAGKLECEMIRAEHLLDRDARLLRSLPQPVGIMAATDRLAIEILNACSKHHIETPNGIGIIGVDNDDLLCSVSTPQLTSVDPGAEKIGLEAARLVDRMLMGEAPPPEPTQIKPTGVVVRGSTDLTATPDVEVTKALRYIRDHACEGLTAGMVMQSVDISRPTLERRFFTLTGRTVRDEIRRVQFERAKTLLVQSRLPVSEIGRQCGFDYYSRFIDLFSKAVGVPPGKFRRMQQ